MTTIATPTATDEEAAKATALAAHEKTHAEAIAAAETPEGAVAAMIKANDDKLAAGGITQAAHDKLTEIYTEAGVDSQKFATLMVASNGFLEQEAAKISEDAINKNVLTALLAEKGIDLESFGSFGAVFAMIFVMIDPEMSKEFMAKMKETAGVDADADVDTEVVVTPVVAGAEDTQPEATVEETISNIAENAQAAAAENTSGTDLGGVDGTAVTYVTPDKPADVAVEGSAVIQTAMINGDSVVSGSFNNNVTVEGSQVNATVDQDAVPTPVTPVIPVIEAEIAEVSVAQHGM